MYITSVENLVTLSLKVNCKQFGKRCQTPAASSAVSILEPRLQNRGGGHFFARANLGGHHFAHNNAHHNTFLQQREPHNQYSGGGGGSFAQIFLHISFHMALNVRFANFVVVTSYFLPSMYCMLLCTGCYIYLATSLKSY